MKPELIERLYDPFELKVREGLGGMKFKYVPSNDIIDRMNKLFEGCWSTEVTSQERMDDFVIVRVSVSAYDSTTEQWFSHAGYGSGSVMRYSGGNKAGQIIDLGNAYKSAESKAIKNACSRWGVGLYLEEAHEDEGGPFTASTGGAGSPSFKTNQSAPANTTPPPFPENNDNTPIPAVAPPIPEMPPVAVDKPKAVETPPTPPVQATASITQEADGPERITDVQKVAIQGLLQIKASLFADVPEKERFVKLMQDALGRTDDLPAKPEGLSYQDAVTVIKYGNDIDKK